MYAIIVHYDPAVQDKVDMLQLKFYIIIHIWRDNIKKETKEKEQEGVDRICVAQNRE